MLPVQRWPIAIVIALAGCGFTLTSGSPGDDGPAGDRITLTDDTEADFTTNAGVSEAEIAKRGAIEPAAYVLGGLHGRAFAGEHVTAASTYASVLAAVGPELGAAYRQAPAEWTSTQNRPRGLSINAENNYTVLFSGDILLPQGPVTLEVRGDDIMVIEISFDGGMTFANRVVSSNSVETLALQVPASGWYPIRASYKQGGGSSFWRMSITPMGSMKVAIDGQRLRKRLTADDVGLIASAFDGKAMLVPLGETTVVTVDEDYDTAGPGHDLLTAVTDQFGVRFAGQVLIDTAADYTFSADIGVEAGDVFRIWIDGAVAASVWPSLTDRLTATIPLEPGWHDLLVDYGDETDAAKVQLKMSGGSIADGPIASSRLRPAIAFGLTASYLGGSSYPLVDATPTNPGVTIVALPLAVPGGGTIASVDYGFGLKEQRLSDLRVDLLNCAGAKTLSPLAAALYYYFAGDTTCAGSPVVPVTPWAWRITDTVTGNDTGNNNPALWDPVLVATYWGGSRMPFAPTFTFVSAPKPTPGAIGFAAVQVTTDLRGTLLTFEMRAGADPAELASASWVTVENGTVPRLTASEFVQYRIAISGDGWKLASIDKVDLTYVVPAE